MSNQLVSFNETRFENQVDQALKTVRQLLSTDRDPTFPADVPHTYDDKYMLVDFMTNTALAAQLTCLELLGLNGEGIQKLKKWSSSRSITLRLASVERCTFDREVSKEVEDPVKHVTELRGFGSKFNITDKVVRTVTEYFFKFDVQWTLFAFEGNDPESRIVFQTRSSSYEIVSSSKDHPRPKVHVHPDIDVNISWLFETISPEFSLQFSIDRSSPKCRTPRRNPAVERALNYFSDFHRWMQQTRDYFLSHLFPVQTNHGLDLGKINDDGTFVPVVPLFENPEDKKKGKEVTHKSLATLVASKSPCVLQVGDIAAFLGEQKRSLQERMDNLSQMFPSGEPKGKGKIISDVEAKLIAVVVHSGRVCQSYFDVVNYVEEMLRQQLISAIGKEVQTTDFVQYMLYHNRTLFKNEFQPKGFSHAIRRPDHFPEGIVSIDSTVGEGLPEPIQTVSSVKENGNPMYFKINASTRVFFKGARHLHGWVSNKFSGNSGMSLSLTARARQFSCFILMIGKIGSKDSFEPKSAILIQNKDELKIPLICEDIPTPKQFRDAIESLSPEQQRFCQLYRGMQLASSLFAVCVVQVKPQLEKLLQLPYDSLTKEIKLTQDLMELFTKYQIPPDLLTFNGRNDASVEEKVKVVQGYVAVMFEMIEGYRLEELKEVEQEARMAKLQVQTTVMNSLAFDGFGGSAPQVLSSASGGKSGFSSAPGGALRGNSGARRHASPKNASLSIAAAPLATPVVDALKPAVEPAKQPSSDPSKQIIKKQENQSEPNERFDDFTALPGLLDKRFQEYDEDNALHTTIVSASKNWTLTSQKSLLAEPTTESYLKEQQKKAKNNAFDLMDALSRSGVLTLDFVELHVLLAATHCFDSSLMNTVIQENVNPIEKVERSTLILAMTVHGKGAAELLKGDQFERVSTFSPILFKGAKPVEAEKSKDKGKKPKKELK